MICIVGINKTNLMKKIDGEDGGNDYASYRHLSSALIYYLIN